MRSEEVAAIVAAGSAASLMVYAVRGRSSSLLAPSIYHGDRKRRSIALTFDDGPSESTPELLDVLARYGVRSTFFQIGANIRRLPEIARQVAADKHEIGNHSQTHPRLDFRSRAFILAELAAAQDSIQEVTGHTAAYFRAPFGVRWFGLRQVQRRLRLMGVMWTTIGIDWRLPPEGVVERLAAGARNGAILCLHDGRELSAKPDIGVTIEAVRKTIPILMDRGFQFETISEIVCPTI